MDLLERIDALFEFDVIRWQFGLGCEILSVQGLQGTNSNGLLYRPQCRAAPSRTAVSELQKAKRMTCRRIRRDLNILMHGVRDVLPKSLELVHVELLASPIRG